MNTYDIVIIGAGLAGCSAALTAAQHGVTVLLIEKGTIIGQPVKCAEYIPKMMLPEIDLENKAVVNTVKKLHSILPSGAARAMNSPGYIINKDQYTRNIAIKAVNAGAHLIIGGKALKRENNRITILHDRIDITVDAKIIIGADGPFSTVGKWIDSRNKKRLTAVQYTYVNPHPEQENMDVYFHPAYTCGYGWVFPKKHVVNVGVGVDTKSGGNVKEAFRVFKDHLTRVKCITSDQELAYSAGVIPTGGILPVIQKENIILIGDAAGLADPITGGGNFPAIVSGKYAGEIAAQAVLEKNFDLLANYESKIKYMFGRTMDAAVKKREYMEKNWSTMDLNHLIKKTWVGFKEYYRD